MPSENQPNSNAQQSPGQGQEPQLSDEEKAKRAKMRFPEPPTAPKAAPQPNLEGDSQTPAPHPPPIYKSNNRMLIGLGVAVIVIILIILLVLPKGSNVSTSTVTTTLGYSPVSSCTQIKSPGTYLLVSDIPAGNGSGACITITSSNVNLNGNGHNIYGPSKASPKGYTYGISLGSASGVVIQNLTVSKFPFGIYFYNSSNNTVENVTVKNATVAGIYLLPGSVRNLLTRNKLNQINGSQGAIYLQGNNNTVSRSAIEYNSYYGLIVNSTGNRIYNNTLLGNPVDLSCQYNSGYRTFNKFGNTTCYVNDYCNFATCTQINLQETPQLVVLHGVINSCGDIEQQGTYVLSSNLNMENYINTSQQSTFPCLTVSVSNVHINCNGYAISNSNFGIFSANQLNVSVSDCKLNNNKYGIYLLGALRFGLTGITGNGNTYGLYLYNSTLGNLTDISMRSGTYGIYLNRSTFISLANVTSKQNTYGAFMDNSSTLTLSSSTYANNSKDDLFCQANDYNTTTSSLSASQCGRTDCSWATQCAVHTLPQLVAVGISSCTTITVPGPYVLTANPIYQGNGDCIKIASGNVTISCSNHTINGFGTGTGIYANGVSNIGLSQCKFRSLSQGAVIQNSSSDTVQNIWMDSVHSGLSFVNTPDLVLSNSTIYNYSSFAYSFNSLNRSTVVYDNATHGIGNTTSAGFAFVKAFNNTIENDTASSGSGYGFNFQTVKNNIIKNNTGNGNNVDFICSPDSSGLYADRGNLNYGLDKIGCKWLVAVPPTSLLQIQCVLLNSPSQISLKYDAWYPFGNTCYSVISNATNHATNTQINCNGHTIFAVNAGTFARVVNTSAVTIENCVLYGFNTAINATSKTPQTNLDLINDTIGNTTTAISSTNYQSTIRNNYITNSTYGIVLSVANSSQLQNNLIANVNNGITISKTSTVSIINDTTSGGFGVSLYNASSVSLQSSNLHGSSSGLYCSTSSAPKSSFSTDMGGNSCSSTNCLWVTSASCPYNASSGTSKQSFSSASSPKAKQTFPSGSCYVSRSGKPAFAGTCNNATPIYVAMLTNGTTISSSGSSNSSTKQYSVASWFYLSKPYHNSSDNVTLNFSANKWYSLVTALNYTNINKENENVYVNGNYLLTAKRIQLFALLEFAVNADYKYISNYQYYNSSITQQQAARIYSEGLGGAPANLSSLTGWFPLNDNTLDYSGRNQNFAYSGLAFTKSFTPP